jgi:hypothetical protein
MKESGKIIDLNLLIQKHPKEVQKWIESILLEETDFPENFNWLGLAEVSGSIARDKIESEDFNLGYSWAEISIFIYDLLANSTQNLSERLSFQESSMLLRTCLIKKSGSREGDFILDKNIIINWFFDNLEFKSIVDLENEISSISKLQESDKLTKLPENIGEYIERIKNLRNIKRRLSIIKLLSENDQINLSISLKDWISKWGEIP